MKLAKLIGAACLTLLVMSSCQHKNVFQKPWETPYGTAPFSRISDADYIPAVKAGIEAIFAKLEK